MVVINVFHILSGWHFLRKRKLLSRDRSAHTAKRMCPTEQSTTGETPRARTRAKVVISCSTFSNVDHGYYLQNTLCCTVEPLTNDHPHQRPSLSYDHISCDGQWFLFVYESLTSDHPSYTTTRMWLWGWSYKRGSTVSHWDMAQHDRDKLDAEKPSIAKSSCFVNTGLEIHFFLVVANFYYQVQDQVAKLILW